MIKQKLINKRIERNKNQDDMAHILGITQSQYSRRESGNTKISKKEWDSLAKELNVKLEEIYEPEDGVYIINSENALGNFGNGGTFNNFSEFALETMRKYIQKLEEENVLLKNELKSLR
jgi:transcriptional regulator with XRE-family HTH domain